MASTRCTSSPTAGWSLLGATVWDLLALGIMTQDRGSIADVLPGMKMPCLLFAGDADPRFAKVQQCAAQLSNATFFSLPGRDHIGGMVASALVVPRITAFLASSAN